VARIGERRVSHRNVLERYRLEDIGMDGRILLKWIFSKQDEVVDWIGPGQVHVAVYCEHDNRTTGSSRCGKFF
jgi:hypothetical protein